MGSEPSVTAPITASPRANPLAEPSGALRRLLLLALVTGLLAFVIMLGRTLIAEQADWRTLPDGSRVRIFSASYGTRHSAVFPCNTWARHYLEVVPKRGWRGVLQGSLWSREHGGGGRFTKTPCTMIFFQVGDHKGPLSYEAEVEGDDGEVIRAVGQSGNSAATTYFVAGLIFERFPTSRQKVHLRTKLDGVAHVFEINNPAYMP